MKKVLIISYLFAPKSAIGAVRWTKIAKYLGRSGIVTDIITRTEEGFADELLAKDAEEINGVIHRVAHSKDFPDTAASVRKATTTPVAVSVKGPINKIKRSRIVRAIRENLNRTKVYRAQEQRYRTNVDFCEQVIDYMQKNNIDPTKYDAVISSFGPAGCALIAARLKELYPTMRLIMDFRDPMTNFMQAPKINKRNLAIQRSLCENADVVLTVSNGCAEKIGEGKHRDKIRVVYNGYDVEDTADVAQYDSENFSFCFTGSLYDGKMDVSPLFQALSRLVRENDTVRREDIVFHYAGGNFAVLAAQAQKYGMGDILRDHGQLQRKECLALQRRTRQLVFCSWNFKGSKGILTGKMFEYLMMRRSMIGLVSGKLPNSEVRGMVEELNGGFVYEQGERRERQEALYQYIKKDYERYDAGLTSENIPEMASIEKFDYKNIAAQIADILQ